jgi:hypothetical protein
MRENYFLSWNIAQEVNYLTFCLKEKDLPKISTLFYIGRVLFYSSQILLAMESLHKQNIIYRE